MQMHNIRFVTKIQDITHIHLYRLWVNESLFLWVMLLLLQSILKINIGCKQQFNVSSSKLQTMEYDIQDQTSPDKIFSSYEIAHFSPSKELIKQTIRSQKYQKWNSRNYYLACKSWWLDVKIVTWNKRDQERERNSSQGHCHTRNRSRLMRDRSMHNFLCQLLMIYKHSPTAHCQIPHTTL